MKATEFCYWLQGYFEMTDPVAQLEPWQVDLVRKHLNMVFIHDIDPSYPVEQQDALEKAHGAVCGVEPSPVKSSGILPSIDWPPLQNPPFNPNSILSGIHQNPFDGILRC